MSGTGAPRIAAVALLRTLGEELHAPGPAFRSLAGAIARAVERGDVPGATLLPSERSLAQRAGLSRGTVVAAYELLRDDGVVLRRQGSGTWVRSASSNDGLVETFEHAAAIRARRLTARVLEPRPEVIDLGLSVLSEPWGLDGIDLGVDLDQLVEAGRHHGYLPNGLPELRAAIARRYTEAGVPTSADEVAITHGAQHALALAARLLVQPGDEVALESPTFPGAIDAFSRAGARFTTVPSDTGGARPGQVGELLAQGSTRILYLVPTCHSATGSVMPPHRRHELATLLDDGGTWLIEDETLAPLEFRSSAAAPAASQPTPQPARSIAASMRSTRHVLLGSLSKCAWAGLRVGWMRADASTISRLARLRAATDLGGSIAAQLVALRCLDGLEDRTVALCDGLAARAEHLRGALAERLPDWTTQTPDGGLSLWCRLPSPSADELAALAPSFGVSVLPGSATSADDDFADRVRLSFALPEPVLDEGVRRLAAAWATLVPGASTATAAPIRRGGQP